MTVHLRTPEQIDAFADALQASVRTGAPIDLAKIATETPGPHIVAHTEHYQILDHGANHNLVKRFELERKPEFSRSRVVLRWASADTAELLIDAMHEAERFHIENLPYCGGF